MSEHEYPTDDELKRIREWPLDDPRGWLDFAQGIWHFGDWGWPELEGEVSTGGWSGNEEIIDAMQDAHMGLLWHQVWRSTRRGGHYTLRLTDEPVKIAPCEECENLRARLARAEQVIQAARQFSVATAQRPPKNCDFERALREALQLYDTGEDQK